MPQREWAEGKKAEKKKPKPKMSQREWQKEMAEKKDGKGNEMKSKKAARGMARVNG